MRTFTFDTNCIIAVDEQRPEAHAIRALAEANGIEYSIFLLRKRAKLAAHWKVRKDGFDLQEFFAFVLAALFGKQSQSGRPACFGGALSALRASVLSSRSRRSRRLQPVRINCEMTRLLRRYAIEGLSRAETLTTALRSSGDGRRQHDVWVSSGYAEN